MSIHKTRFGTWEVRYRHEGKNRSKTFKLKRDAEAFEAGREEGKPLPVTRFSSWFFKDTPEPMEVPGDVELRSSSYMIEVTKPVSPMPEGGEEALRIVAALEAEGWRRQMPSILDVDGRWHLHFDDTWSDPR